LIDDNKMAIIFILRNERRLKAHLFFYSLGFTTTVLFSFYVLLYDYCAVLASFV